MYSKEKEYFYSMFWQAKSTVSILLAMTYCCYANLFVQVSLSSDQDKDQTHQLGEFPGSLTAGLHANSSKSEHASDSLLDDLRRPLKDSNRSPWIASQTLEHLIEGRFLQYQRFRTEFHISFWKSDIVFPFHQFW